MQRHRTSGGFSDSTAEYLWWNTLSGRGNPVSHTITHGDGNGTLIEMDDVTTPNFYERIADGNIINNPMSKVSLKYEWNDEGPNFRKDLGGVSYHGECNGHMPWIQPNVGLIPVHTGISTEQRERLKNDVATRARANAASGLSYDGMVALGELRENLSYLRNPFKTGLKLAKLLNRRVDRYTKGRQPWRLERAPTKSEVDYLSDLFLEFRFGAMPLVADLQKFALALLERRINSPRRTTRSWGVLQSSGVQWTELVGINDGAITASVDYTMDETYEVRVGFLDEVQSEISFNDKWGLNITHLPQAAWALLPLSFIVDRYFNVSNFIGAGIPTLGQKHLAEWLTIDEKVLLITEPRDAVFHVSGWYTEQDFTGSCQLQRVVRRRTPVAPAPTLTLRPSAVDWWKDAGQLLEMAVLIRQRLAPLYSCETWVQRAVSSKIF